jgi:hypothetical protein
MTRAWCLVEDAHVTPITQQNVHDVGTDEAAAARDEDATFLNLVFHDSSVYLGLAGGDCVDPVLRRPARFRDRVRAGSPQNCARIAAEAPQGRPR